MPGRVPVSVSLIKLNREKEQLLLLEDLLPTQLGECGQSVWDQPGPGGVPGSYPQHTAASLLRF